MSVRTTAACLLCLLASVPATAGEDASRWRVGAFVSGLGGIVHRDAAFGGDAFLLAGRGSFRLAVGVPLRFGPTGIREQDWDEVSDFGRLLGEASWGRRGDAFRVRAAPLQGLTLGTGAIVSRLASVADPDHWRTGLEVAFDAGFAGADLFVDSIPMPSVAGGRLLWRPLQPLSPDGIAGRLELGWTAVGDFSAPASNVRDAAGTQVDDAGLPVSDRTAFAAIGLDVRWPLVKTAQVEFTPHVSWSHLSGGAGLAAGLSLSVHPVRKLRLGLSGEWRRMTNAFAAPYFDGLYFVERHDQDGLPRLQSVRGLSGVRTGMQAGLTVAWTGLVETWVLLDLDRNGAFCGLRAGAVVEAGPVRAAASWTGKGFDSAAGAFRPDRLLAAASVDVRVAGPLAVFAAYARDLDVAASGPLRGRYRSSDSALGGLRVEWRR